MSEDFLQDSMLIEGFDPEKLAELQAAQVKDTGWQEVYGAYQNRKILNATVEAIEEIGTITCAIVHVKNVRGMIPIDFFGVERKNQLRQHIGKDVAFKILNYNREEEIFTGSRTQALEHMAEIMLKRTEVGDTRVAVVNGVGDSFLYADIGGIQVRVPINEIRYGWIDDLREEHKIGDHILVKVLEINKPEIKKDSKEKASILDTEVVVSQKALQENPWDSNIQKYTEGKECLGIVSGVAEFGTFINIEDGIDSVAIHMKFEKLKKGDKVLLRIEDVDVKKEQVRSKVLRVIERV